MISGHVLYLLIRHILDFMLTISHILHGKKCKRFFKHKGYSDISQIFISANNHGKSSVNTIFFLHFQDS